MALKVTPKAARDAIEGMGLDTAGRPCLTVRVTAAPEDGKANAAVARLLARAWRVPKGSVTVIAGQAARHKRLLVSGDGAALAEQVNKWFDKEFGTS